MPEYIDRDDFIEKERKQFCAECNRRKGMRRGKMRVLYMVDKYQTRLEALGRGEKDGDT